MISRASSSDSSLINVHSSSVILGEHVCEVLTARNLVALYVFNLIKSV